MAIPVALYIKNVEGGFDLIVKTLHDGVEHAVNDGVIKRTTKAYDLFDYLVQKTKDNDNYDIQYISEDIL